MVGHIPTTILPDWEDPANVTGGRVLAGWTGPCCNLSSTRTSGPAGPLVLAPVEAPYFLFFFSYFFCIFCLFGLLCLFLCFFVFLWFFLSFCLFCLFSLFGIFFFLSFFCLFVTIIIIMGSISNTKPIVVPIQEFLNFTTFFCT